LVRESSTQSNIVNLHVSLFTEAVIGMLDDDGLRLDSEAGIPSFLGYLNLLDKAHGG